MRCPGGTVKKLSVLTNVNAGRNYRTTTKLQLLMKKKTRVIIEHGDERYEVKFNRDCTRTCSFVKYTPYGPCENNCSLPKWFEKIAQKFPESHLKRIDKE